MKPKGRRQIVRDCTKSAFGFGALCWILSALIYPVFDIEFSEAKQLLTFFLAAVVGAGLAYLLREPESTSAGSTNA